jgi:hypothetical protein
MKRGKRRWMVLTGLLGTGLLVLRSARDPLENVLAGDLEYSNQWGWINWRHARNTGVAAFWKDLNTRMEHAGAEPLTITYRQQMSNQVPAINSPVPRRHPGQANAPHFRKAFRSLWSGIWGGRGEALNCAPA